MSGNLERATSCNWLLSLSAMRGGDSSSVCHPWPFDYGMVFSSPEKSVDDPCSNGRTLQLFKTDDYEFITVNSFVDVFM